MKIRVAVIEPGKPPIVQLVENTLKTMQDLVGGYVEQVPVLDQEYKMLVNEEGLMLKLKPNFGRIVGTAVLVGQKKDQWSSLGQRQITEILTNFKR